MALENLQAATRIEAILNGDNITPATRREYFLQKAVNNVPTPAGGGGFLIVTIATEFNALTGKTLITSVNKTIAEIIEAFENGQLPFLYEATGENIGGLYTPNVIDTDNTSLVFARPLYGNIASIGAYLDEITGNDTWEYSEEV